MRNVSKTVRKKQKLKYLDFLKLSAVRSHVGSFVHWFSCYYMLTHG